MNVSSTAPTDSGHTDDVEPVLGPALSSDQAFHLKHVPAVVSWQDYGGKNCSLEDLRLTITCTAGGIRNAMLKLHATGRIKKAPAKPDLLLLIQPEQIEALRCVEDGDNNNDQERQYQQAVAKLQEPIYTLRFDMRQRLTFIVPRGYPFASFRTASQHIWRSMKSFAQATKCFDVHFPVSVVQRHHLVLFCRAISGGSFTWQATNIARLYGGRGGKVVDLDDTDSDEVDASADMHADAPPAYDEHRAANSSAAPPLCLSPSRNTLRPYKRRRSISNSDSDICGNAGKKKQEEREPKQAAEVQQSHGIMSAEVLARLSTIEDRLSKLEERQANMMTELAEDLETHVRPLLDSFSDEMNDLLVSQEIQDEESIRDVATEAVGEVVSESLEEAINDYFAGGGKDLIDSTVREAVDKILGQRIQEGIRQSLRAQRFTGTFIIDAEHDK